MAIKIYIDQGHGPGVNAGAEGFGLLEQDITYMVGSYLADIFRLDDRFEVKTSRNSITEKFRKCICRKDFFILIHNKQSYLQMLFFRFCKFYSASYRSEYKSG